MYFINKILLQTRYTPLPGVFAVVARECMRISPNDSQPSTLSIVPKNHYSILHSVLLFHNAP